LPLFPKKKGKGGEEEKNERLAIQLFMRDLALFLYSGKRREKREKKKKKRGGTHENRLNTLEYWLVP